MLGWVVGGLAMVVAVAVFLRGRMYRRLFSDAHFIEIGERMVGLKAAALAKVIPQEDDDLRNGPGSRGIVTAAGLAIVYTVHQRGLDYVHHCSVGVSGDITARGVGEPFTALVMSLIGLPLSKATFHVGASTIHHANVVLDSDEHEKVASTSVPEVSGANVNAFWRAALAARSEMTWTQVAG
jgi:hypothetical protein